MTTEKSFWRAFGAAARRAAAWPFRVAAARATLRTLANMDHRELADIGLVGSDLRDVSALALDCDPTALLAQRAQERRQGAFGASTPACGGSRRTGGRSRNQTSMASLLRLRPRLAFMLAGARPKQTERQLPESEIVGGELADRGATHQLHVALNLGPQEA